MMKLEKIREEVNRLLDELLENKALRKEKGLENQGVNWGAVCCIDIIEAKGMWEDNPYYIIEIDECSPEAYKFKEYIKNKLKEKYPALNFEIKTEW